MSADRDHARAPSARGYGFGAKLWNFVVIVLIFALVGPPVGALAFTALVSLWMARTATDPASAGLVFSFLSLYGVVFSWFIGGLHAALTGLVFATWQTFVGRAGWAFAGLVGLGAGFALAVAAGDGFAAEPGEPPMLPLYLVTCFAPTVVCWAMARSFVTE